MDKSGKQSSIALSKQAPRSETRAWSAEEVASYIRFQLSELAGTNGHHNFEQLCFHLARRRIYPNIIPATGPVSAGGDQGADFETFAVGSGGSSRYFANASDSKVVFACSLEKNYKKKIKEDLDDIAKAQTSAKKVDFFSSGHVPVGIRHRLQEYAKGAHGIELEVFDSFAISELLADSEVFWIATRFLSIPGDVLLAVPVTPGNSWYEEAKALEIDADHATTADFITIKSAVRHATSEVPLHSDLPGLISKLQTFQKSGAHENRRRAFYEEYVASIRGLEFVGDCSERLESYFSDVPHLSETAEIEDAAILVHYSAGARKRGLLDLPLDQILSWRKMLLARINDLLAENGISPGRRSSLLDSKAFLTLLDCLQEAPKRSQEETGRLVLASAQRSFTIWRKMLKHVRESPMFPLETFARRLAMFAAEYGEVEGYEQLSEETERLLASRTGQHKLGEQAFERSKSYSRAGRLLDAIDQLHLAHVKSFTRETAQHTVFIPLFLAKMYSEVGLHAAAKYYALASSFAALKTGVDELKQYIYRGLAEAAANDHANGASLGFFLTLKATVFVSSQFSASGPANIQDFEWGRLYFYACILTYGASFVDESLAKHLKDEILPRVGLKDLYEEALPETKRFFERYSSYQEFAIEAVRQNVTPPFADALAIRRLAWKQLGLNWTVEWENNYETTEMAEGFAALLQILLTDLRKIELSLFPSEVNIGINVHSGKLRIEEVSSNDRVIRKIFLPKESLGSGIVFGVATSILKVVSAYPDEKFLKIIQKRMEQGLVAKTNPHAPYDVLFQEFYLTEDFEALHKFTSQSTLQLTQFMLPTHEGLSGPSGIHPEYNRNESLRLIKNRYTRSSGLLKYTLPRLLKNEAFRSTVATLRSEGWKDWHILLAIGGIRLNFVANQTTSRDARDEQYRNAIRELMEREEAESDTAPPEAMFTVEEMRRSLTLSQFSTLKGMGLECWQKTPVMKAVDAFLQRFNYWTDDVEHTDPFV
jgi:hypothetical protein